MTFFTNKNGIVIVSCNRKKLVCVCVCKYNACTGHNNDEGAHT